MLPDRGFHHRCQNLFGSRAQAVVLCAKIVPNPFGRPLQHCQHNFCQLFVHRHRYASGNREGQEPILM